MATEKQVLQFKVTLDGVQPTVWRRFQVLESYNFWDLHVAIQDVMGWDDSHLHVFRVRKSEATQTELIGVPDEDAVIGGSITLPGRNVPILDYFPGEGASAKYEYDFGDGWQHTITLEKILPLDSKTHYPLCLAGARACPPENCGGPVGYEELLEVIQDPAHEDHESILEWVGENYEPSAFDPKSVAFDNPQKRWRQAFGSDRR